MSDVESAGNVASGGPGGSRWDPFFISKFECSAVAGNADAADRWWSEPAYNTSSAAGRSDCSGWHRSADLREGEGSARPAQDLAARHDRHRRFLQAVQRTALLCGRPDERLGRIAPRRAWPRL